METTLVRIGLSSEVCISRHATFDGLLAYCMVQDKKSRGTLTSYNECTAGLPLRKLPGSDSGWLYSASSWFVPAGVPCVEQEIIFHKRTNLSRVRQFVPSHKRTISPKSGIDRGYQFPLYAYALNEICFLFDGDAEEIRYLLGTWLTGVGKKTAAGLGAVRSIDLKRVEENPVLCADGSARRPIPRDMAVSLGVTKGLERLATYAFRPPYVQYEPGHQAICIMPPDPQKRGFC